MSTLEDNLPFDLVILVDSIVVFETKFAIERYKNVEIEWTLKDSYRLCRAGKHVHHITFQLTSRFDDEMKINAAGFWDVPNVAQYLIKNIITFLKEISLDCYWAASLDLVNAVTDDCMMKISNDYKYTEMDVKGFFGRPYPLENHVFVMFQGVERSMPKDKSDRKILLQEYEEKSKNVNFDKEQFWNDYTWSVIREEKKELLKQFSVTTKTSPNSLVYRSLSCADYKLHKRPESGLICREIDIKIGRCRICYQEKGVPLDFEAEEPLPRETKFLIQFRSLSEITICKKTETTTNN